VLSDDGRSFIKCAAVQCPTILPTQCSLTVHTCGIVLLVVQPPCRVCYCRVGSVVLTSTYSIAHCRQPSWALHVGNLILIQNDESLPADICCLYSARPHGVYCATCNKQRATCNVQSATDNAVYSLQLYCNRAGSTACAPLKRICACCARCRLAACSRTLASAFNHGIGRWVVSKVTAMCNSVANMPQKMHHERCGDMHGMSLNAQCASVHHQRRYHEHAHADSHSTSHSGRDRAV
jgi:hypothetical protein